MRTITPERAVTIPAEAKKVFSGITYDVFHWQQQLYDGSFTTFEMLRRPDTVRVVAIKDDKLVILKQQQPNRPVFYDVPGGLHDQAEETELQAAQRELREEAGLEFANWRLLAVTQPNARIDWLIYTFLATECSRQLTPRPEAGERIEVQLCDLNQAKRLLGGPSGRSAIAELMAADSLEALRQLPPFQ